MWLRFNKAIICSSKIIYHLHISQNTQVIKCKILQLSHIYHNLDLQIIMLFKLLKIQMHIVLITSIQVEINSETDQCPIIQQINQLIAALMT